MNFTQIVQQMNDVHEKTKQLPIAIKVNEQWLEKQMQQNFILRDKGEKANSGYLGNFTGLPVQIDNEISTFEFVYREEE
jgi:hypothetical protein